MAPVLHSLLLLLLLSSLLLVSSATNKSSGSLLNQIDKCWRLDPNWASNREALADCSVGFGATTKGGKGGKIYVVTDTSDDPAKPKPGTLRYGVIQEEPLWIIFERDMSLKFENELIVNSYKTIDGRGAKVEFTKGPCVTIQEVSHIIIHGIHIHDCTEGKYGYVASSVSHVGRRRGSDGDAIAIFGASYVWIDHCTFSSCADGLVDVIHASTAITISNCYFTDHDKVMLLGHDDSYDEDKKMKVTVVYNYFGPKLVQRIPRVRLGYVHVANNRYEKWEMYAIGGSANPTILSHGNYFEPMSLPDRKEVTKRETGGWKQWKWSSRNDKFLDDAFFVPSGYGSVSPDYSGSENFVVMVGAMVPDLTQDSGVLECQAYHPCINF